MPATLEVTMTRRDTMPVRLGNDAIAAAKKAAALNGQTLTEYATRVLLEHANADIARFVQAQAKKMKAKPAKGEGGGE